MFQTKIFALSLYWLGQLLSHLLFWLYQSKEARKRLLLSKCYHVRTIWNDSDGNTETRNRLIVVVQGSVSSCLTKYWICLCKMINLDLLCCTMNERLDTRLLHWDITVTYVCLLRIFKRSSWYYKRRKKNRTKCWRSYNKTWKDKEVENRIAGKKGDQLVSTVYQDPNLTQDKVKLLSQLLEP